jgi:hypothetical protein
VLSVVAKARLITLTETLIIRDITKTVFNNCSILYIAFSLTLSTNNDLSHKTMFGENQTI